MHMPHVDRCFEHCHLGHPEAFPSGEGTHIIEHASMLSIVRFEEARLCMLQFPLASWRSYWLLHASVLVRRPSVQQWENMKTVPGSRQQHFVLGGRVKSTHRAQEPVLVH